MIREKVLALSDDELQHEVAKARGYEVKEFCEVAHCPVPEGHTPVYCLYGPDGWRGGSWESDPEQCWRGAPDYPHDIAVAWTLVTEFSEQKNKNFSLSHSNVTDKWNCIICHSERRGQVEYIMSEAGMGEGDTAPQAICRAYLLAKER